MVLSEEWTAEPRKREGEMQDYHDACRNFSVAELERKILQGSPTTHNWHAASNPRIRNCSTVAKASTS
jgi:hypothetical protein